MFCPIIVCLKVPSSLKSVFCRAVALHFRLSERTEFLIRVRLRGKKHEVQCNHYFFYYVCVCAHLLGPLISSISHPAHAVLTVHKHLMHIGRLLMYSGGHNILQQFMIWVFAHMNKYIHTCMSEYICVCVFSCKPNCIHGYNTNPNHYLFLSVCFSSILLL